jgi:hypothetical protein
MMIRDVIQSHGDFAARGNPDAAAEAWAEAGFNAAEVEEWLKARCFDAGAARDLADADVTAAMAATRTEAGRGDYTDTVGFKVADGDLEVGEAREIAAAF